MTKPSWKKGARLARDLDLFTVTLDGPPPLETTMEIAKACTLLEEERQRLRRKLATIEKMCRQAVAGEHPYPGTVLSIVDLLDDMGKTDGG